MIVPDAGVTETVMILAVSVAVNVHPLLVPVIVYTVVTLGVAVVVADDEVNPAGLEVQL